MPAFRPLTASTSVASAACSLAASYRRIAADNKRIASQAIGNQHASTTRTTKKGAGIGRFDLEKRALRGPGASQALLAAEINLIALHIDAVQRHYARSLRMFRPRLPRAPLSVVRKQPMPKSAQHILRLASLQYIREKAVA